MRNPFRKVRIEPEAYQAYLQRLPESIHVAWKRDGTVIIGDVTLGEMTFGVEAKDELDFINLVNEGVLLAYDTPEDYLEPLGKAIQFRPTKDALEALRGQAQGESDLLINAEDKMAFA